MLEMTRKMTGELEDQRVQAEIAEFEAKREEEQTAKTLLDSLSRLYTGWERHQAAKHKLAATLEAAIAKRRKANGNKSLTVTGAAAMNTDRDGNPLCN